jgi:hypothetical protein
MKPKVLIFHFVLFCQLLLAQERRLINEDTQWNDVYDTDQSECLLMTSDSISRCIRPAIEPAEKKNLLSKLLYIYSESQSIGELDFYAKCPLIQKKSRRTLFCIHNQIYDAKDFGNFLWGVALGQLKIPLYLVITGSELNGFFNCQKQNPDIQRSLPFCVEGDSDADQRAIKAGYYYQL